VSFSDRVVNGVMGYRLYLYKMAWPSHLAAFYPLRHWSIWAAVAAALGLLAVTGASVIVRRSRPYVLVGWLWYLIALLPMIGFVQAGAQAIADRYMYLPMIGPLIIVAWGVPDLAAAWPDWARTRVLSAMAVAVLIVSAFMTRTLAASWSDSVALWQHATVNTQDNYLAYVNLGSALVERGDLTGGLAAYREGLAALHGKWPGYQAAIHCNIGLALARQDRSADALAEFSEAARLNPDLAEAYAGQGDTLARQGRLPEAVDAFSAALRVNPHLARALTGMGSALLAQNRSSDAIPYFAKAIDLEPSVAATHNAYGSALAMNGRSEAAMAEFQAAARLEPDFAAAYVNMGHLLADEGKTADAKRTLERALSLDPTNEGARELLATLVKVGR
jgi:tetratricopeptide (TPR) repeat protein